jgi:hypothetical protein
MSGRHRILPPVPASEHPRTFLLDRLIDHSGQSGLGTVALGAVFSNGLTVARWRGHYTDIHPNWRSTTAPNTYSRSTATTAAPN